MALDPKQSSFFTYAESADLGPLSKEDVVVSAISIPVASVYLDTIGTTVPGLQMETTLGIKGSRTVLLSTAEAEAIGGAGLFSKDSSGKYCFCVPRFHLGPAAQLDLSVAMSQLAHTDLMKELIDKSDQTNSGIIQFTREGHLANWQIAVWLNSGKNLPTTLVKISHQKADNPFTRVAHIDGEPNLEGFPEKLERLYVCDPVASGMQHVAMLEYLESLGRTPEELVVVAPMATLFGLRVIALACEARGIRFRAGVLGALLDSLKPLRYFSPYPKDSLQVANINLAAFMDKVTKGEIHRWCIRGNWTASFMGGTDLPLTASEEELVSLGLSNQAVMELMGNVSYQDAEKMGLLPYLLPYSSRHLV